jgi:endonuclease YncB( thermonuclease family)
MQWAAPAPASHYQGRVVGIVDGDTIMVLVNRARVSVRLYGIDAPEKNQPFGTRARQFTSSLAFGKDVTLVARGKDRNRRLIADVILSDGGNLGEELVQAGYAWWFRRYAPKDQRLERMESEARRKRTGLWADPRPVPPWEWRPRR